MPYYVDGVQTHDPESFHPPGITGDDWCHLVSSVSLLDLETFLTLNILTIGASPTNIRTPLLGSNCTYIALTQAQHDAARAAGAIGVPGGVCRAQAFDYPGSGDWEP